MTALRRPYKDQLGKSKTKKRRKIKAGAKGIRWKHSEMKSKNWRRFWNEEG